MMAVRAMCLIRSPYHVVTGESLGNLARPWRDLQRLDVETLGAVLPAKDQSLSECPVLDDWQIRNWTVDPVRMQTSLGR